MAWSPIGTLHRELDGARLAQVESASTTQPASGGATPLDSGWLTQHESGRVTPVDRGTLERIDAASRSAPVSAPVDAASLDSRRRGSSPHLLAHDEKRRHLTSFAAEAAAPGDTATLLRRWLRAAEGVLESQLPRLVAIWIAGVLLLCARLAGGWAQAQRLRGRGTRPAAAALQANAARLASRLGVRRAIRVLESTVAEVPTVVGWLRPVVLFPAGAIAGLPPQHLEALLAHELAHVRRHDYLVNLLQTLVETLLFYHPAVWWVSSRIRHEREHCADDLAVHACGDRVLVARALTAMEELRLSPLHPGVAIAANGGSLVSRIQRLLGRTRGSGAPRGALGPTMLVATLLLGVGLQRAVDAGAAIESQRGEMVVAGSSHANHSDTGVLGPETAFHGEAQPASQLRSPAHPQARPAVEPQPAPHRAHEASVDVIVSLTSQGVAPEFLRQMEALGFVDLNDVLALHQHGVRPAGIRTLRDLGYDLDADALVTLQIQGVDARYIRELAHLGHTQLSVEELVGLRIHGVSARRIRELARIGYEDLSLEEIAALHIQGVDARYIRELRRAGYEDLSVDELVGLRVQGVDARFIRELRRAGLEGLDVDDVVTLRIHGANADFVRELRRQGYDNVDTDELVRLLTCGVNAHYIESMREVGFEELSLEELVWLRDQGIDPRYVRDMRALGLQELDVEEWIELRNQGVDPRDIERMRNLGLDELTITDLVGLQSQGLHARYVQQMIDAGLEPSLEVLVHLHRHGVVPRHLRAIRDGDVSRLSVQDLVTLKNAGVDGELLDSMRKAKP
ncbi:MAG: M56 family metallopeptidase [Candidatus Latescibacterota bacterium]|nr:MAG: M56 family metallopeptidase [Candidatus Latescibacterota bacterium]